MNYAKINTYDSANGPGVRVSLFVSGCEHYCKECFNQEAWDFEYGKEFTSTELQYLIHSMSKKWITGLTILGGEPMHPKNVITVSNIISRIKFAYPDKSVWVYSGYTLDELWYRYETMFLLNETDRYIGFCTGEILKNIDVLVDGRFEIDKKDLSLRFKGSSNQRIIDMPKFITTDEIAEPFIPD